MKKSLKRMVSFLLVLVMVLGLLPAMAVTMVSAANYGGDDNWRFTQDDNQEKPDGIYRIVPAGNPNFSLDIYFGGEEGKINVTKMALICSYMPRMMMMRSFSTSSESTGQTELR